MLRKEERTAHRLLTEIKQEGRFGMKKLFQLVIMCFTALMLSACGTGGGESDEGIQIVESEPLDMAVSAEGEKAEDAENRAPGDNAAEPETDAETADLWTGEYNDRDVNEPNLAIRKNADGSYRIFIGIYRLAVFDDGHGVLTEKGMEINATEPDGNQTGGIITLNGDEATVTFDPGWEGFGTVYSFQYSKTSDTPDSALFAD